jgi:hypothetical protein
MDDATPAPDWVPPPDRNADRPLPASLDPLIELLAERVHNRWAEHRLAEGWRYGAVRDEAGKTTPNLVPYAALPEAEKAVDRATAIATMQTLHGEGYRIGPGRLDAGVTDSAVASVETALAATLTFEAADLLRRSHGADFWAAHPELLYRLARRASDAGWPLLVYDLVSPALARREADDDTTVGEIDAKLRHLEVLSLVEVGAFERAALGLEKIGTGVGIKGDLAGLRGRLAKMQGLRAPAPERARAWFEQAAGIYGEAYGGARDRFLQHGEHRDGDDAYYLGINAATMNAWAGHEQASRTLAAEVLGICDALAERKPEAAASPWLQATRGEAHLLLGNQRGAGIAYRAAADALPGQWRPLQSMRRQALETAHRIGFPSALVESWFNLPGLHVRGFADGPAAAPPAGSMVFFYLHDPAQLETAADLAARASEFHLGTGELLDGFRSRLSPAQASRLDGLLVTATGVHGQNEILAAGEEVTPVFTRLFFRGLALLRARELDLTPHGLPSLAECGVVAGEPLPFRAMLCADAKGYSRLGAGMLRTFCRDYLGCVAAVVERFRAHTVTVKTAGDGLFMVFRDLPSAIRFSLELLDATTAIDWTARGFPEDLALRTSLDAGPVMEFLDPVSGRQDVAGLVVNRAARIEPVTPVNHVYAGRTMAALAAALEIPGVRFEYAGETILPKGFGTFQLYHLTRE